jgi:hypothetical protein
MEQAFKNAEILFTRASCKTPKTVIPEAFLIGNPDSKGLKRLDPRYRNSGTTTFLQEPHTIGLTADESSFG